MEDYLIALRSRDNTPASLLRMDKQHEEEMINNYTSDIKAKIQGKKNRQINAISGFYGIRRITSASGRQLFPARKKIVKSSLVEK